MARRLVSLFLRCGYVGADYGVLIAVFDGKSRRAALHWSCQGAPLVIGRFRTGGRPVPRF